MRIAMMATSPSGTAPRPPAPSRSRAVLLAVIVVAALVGAHTLLWRFMAGQIERGFLAWVQQRRSQGWRIDHAPPAWGGWPFSPMLDIADLVVAGGAQTMPGGFTVMVSRVTLSAALPWIDRLHLDFQGTHRLRLGDQEWRLQAARMTMQLPLASDTLPREAEMTAAGLKVGTGEAEVLINRLRLNLAISSTATEAEPAFELAAESEGIVLPASFDAAASARLGREIAALSFDVALTGPVPPAGLVVGKAEAWRDGGGTVELRNLSLRWGPVSATTAATFALDEELQPMGAGSLRLSGATQALGALSDAGLIGRRAAATARAMLPLLTRQPDPDSPPAIEVPLTIEARTLAIARIPVLRLPSLQWSATPTRSPLD